VTRQVADADALHCPHCGVERRDDRSAFFAYYQITDQIKARHVRCARLIEHRAVAVESNPRSVQKVSRGCASQREYHTVYGTSRMFGFSLIASGVSIIVNPEPRKLRSLHNRCWLTEPWGSCSRQGAGF
jgi:hypothetical protein